MKTKYKLFFTCFFLFISCNQYCYSQRIEPLIHLAPEERKGHDYDEASLEALPEKCIEQSYPDIQLSSMQPNSFTQSLVTDKIVNWISLGPNEMPPLSYAGDNGIGVIHSIVLDPYNPNKIFACSPLGGLFRSIDNGESWQNVGTDTQLPLSGVSCVAIEETWSDFIWYITTGNGHQANMSIAQQSSGVYRTINGGLTWQYIGLENNTSDPYLINKIIKIPNGDYGHLFVATYKGLWEITNGLNGTVYGDIKKQPNLTLIDTGCFFDVELIPDGSQRIIMSETNSEHASDPTRKLRICIYNWVNKSKEWIDYVGFPSDVSGSRISIEISPVRPAEVFIRTAEKGIGNIYRYNLINHNFVPKGYANSQSTCTFNDALAISPVDANIVMYGDVYIRKIISGLDATNSNIPPVGMGYHADIQRLIFTPDGNTIWAGTDGGVFKSTNGGLDWFAKNKGLGVATIKKIGATTTGNIKILSGHQDEGTMLTTYSNGEWTSSHLETGDGYECIIDYTNPLIMYFSYQNATIFRSDSGGMSDYPANSGLPTVDVFNSYTINSLNNSILYEESSKGIYRTINGGISWNKWSTFNASVIASSKNPLFSNYLYSRDDDSIYKSTVGGGIIKSNWVSSKPPANQYMGDIIVDYFNPDFIFNIVEWPKANGKVSQVNTLTNTWTDFSYNLSTDSTIHATCLYQNIKNGDLYLGTRNGVYYLKYGTIKWYRLGGNLPHVRVNDMEINYTNKQLIVGTWGRGLWMTNLLCEPSDANLALPNPVTSSYYFASNTITGSSLVSNNQEVILRAGIKINLNAGFSTSSNDILSAYIEDCGVPFISGIKSTEEDKIIDSQGDFINSKSINTPEILIYPNPNFGKFTIDLKYEENVSSIRIYTIMGTQVSQVGINGSSKTEVDISNSPKGIYYVQINKSNETICTKIIVE
jgi:hypothetical protein